MKIQITDYGKIEIGNEYYIVDPRFNSTKNRRLDTYISNVRNERFEEGIMCVDSNDQSDQATTKNVKYNSHCYGCWAGVGHTINYHNEHSKPE